MKFVISLAFFVILIISLAYCAKLEHESKLVSAAAQGNLVTLQTLLDQDISVDAWANDGWSALTVAAREGHLEAVELLVKKGAAINKVEAGGNTALYWAVFSGHQEVVEFLLEQGATTISRKNLLETAKSRRHQHIVEILKQHGLK